MILNDFEVIQACHSAVHRGVQAPGAPRQLKFRRELEHLARGLAHLSVFQFEMIFDQQVWHLKRHCLCTYREQWRCVATQCTAL
jgi:hypothetical protein